MKKYKWKAQSFDFSNKKDMEGIINLVRSHYDNVDESYPEYFQWEYIDNPAGKAIIWVAKHNDEIVGQYVINLLKVKIGEEIRRGSIVIKTLTRKDFERKGIYVCLANKAFEVCREKGIDLSYGFSNPKVYKANVKRLGFVDIGKVPLLIIPLNIKKLVEQHIQNKIYIKLLTPCIPILSISYNFIFKVLSLKNKIVEYKRIFVNEVNRFDGQINIFWEKIKMKYKNIVVRDKEFLNWRYFKNPRRRYKVFIAENNRKEIISYMVLRISYVNKLKVGYIVDILSNEEKLGNIGCSLLIGKAVEYFKRKSVMIAGCLMLSNKVYFSLLRRHGFLICPKRFEPQPFTFHVKLYTPELAGILYKLDNWLITMGDYDVV